MNISIPVQFNKLTTVCHISDLHIRLYKRHQEYRECFSILYSQLNKYKKQSGVIFVVTGDVNHAKTDMSPEMVQLCSEFLNTLANIAPTLLIAGNHDMNLANQNRLDSLSPIVDNLNNDNLHYLKSSGVYTVADVDFAVFSILGDRSEWPSIDECKSSTAVVLYHGPVYTAETDSGYSVSSRSTMLSDFNNFDIVMLGDIHKQQILKKEKPIVAYAGSLIQQNHGETLNGHGWLEWDIPNRNFKFVELKNPYGYVTIRVENDSASLPTDLPKNARIRLFTTNTDNSDIKKLTALLRTKCNVIELTVNKLDAGMIAAGATSGIVEDVHDISYQNSLIKEYLYENYPSADLGVIDRVIALNESLNIKLDDNELPHNIVWRPINLKFDNLFSYGAGNEISFENMNGLYGVFSPNATGKTSAFDAMCFALYDKTPRAFKGSHIMNTRTNNCFCELEIEINGNKYKIVRRGERKKNGDVKIDVDFLKYSNNTWIILNGEDRRDTNSIIRSYVGDYEDFVLTNLSVQNQNSLFIDKGQSDRKDLLSQFMGLTIFDKLYDLASEEIKEVYGALKRFNKDDFTQILVDTQEKLADADAKYKDISSKILCDETKQNEISNNIKNKLEKRIVLDGDTLNIDELHAEKDTLEKKLFDGKTQIEELNKKLLNTKQLIKANQKELPDEESIIQLEKQYRENSSILQSYTTQVILKTAEIADCNKKIDKLKDYKYNPNCEFCVQNQFVIDARMASQQLIILEEEIKKIYNNVDFYSELNKELESAILLREKYNSITYTLNSLNRRCLEEQVLIERLSGVIASTKTDLSLVNNKIDLYYAKEEIIKTNALLDIEIQKLTSERDLIENQLVQNRLHAQTLYGQIQVLESKKLDIIKQVEEAESLEADYEAYEYYMSAICRDGIPYRLISKIIPDIQSTVNNILTQIVDFVVEMDVDGKNINGKIVYGDEKTWPLELASGMEKFVSSLAIRIALMKVSSLPRSNFLIIDEGMGVLDSDNLSSMFMLFDVLKTEFEFVILISHLDSVRDITDNLLEIKRQDGFSYINV